MLKNLGITTKKGVMSDDDDVVEFQSEVFVVLPTHVVFGGSDPELFTLPQPLIDYIRYLQQPTNKMINRQAITIVLAAAATSNAFVVPSHSTVRQRSNFRPLCSSVQHKPTPSSALMAAKSAEEDIELTLKVIMASMTDDGAGVDDSDDDATDPAPDAPKMIVDVPPSPVAPEPVAATAAPVAAAPVAAAVVAPKKKGGNPHKEGVFSPIVVAAGAVLGDKMLNEIRGKVIALHSDLIKSFVDTADSALGQAVLRQLFNFVDVDKSGYLDKKEVATALNMLGFKWLGEKQVNGIFARADENGDAEISLEEFMVEAPKTLRTNLVKLAKSNGGEMGLLV